MEVPATPAERLELKKKLLVERLHESRKQRLAAVGDRPYLGQQLSKEERMAQYGQIRQDPEAWAGILQRVGRPKEDGRLLLPKRLLKEIEELEGELRYGTI